jgi:hypothetical protein
VCGEGRVDQTGFYDEPLGQVLPKGCDLSAPCESYLWQVLASGIDSGEECLREVNPQNSGAVEARGVEHERRCLVWSP